MNPTLEETSATLRSRRDRSLVPLEPLSLPVSALREAGHISSRVHTLDTASVWVSECVGVCGCVCVCVCVCG